MGAQTTAPTRTRRPSTRSAARSASTLRAVDVGPKLPFDVVESKIQPPQLRAGTVSRNALVNRLRAGAETPIVTVCAPAGYGKTTLLAQWAARDSRPFAWVSSDERDNDPITLLRSLVAAVDPIEPVGQGVLDALCPGDESIWSSAVPRVGSHLWSLRSAFVLVVDDSHLLRSHDSLRALSTLAEHLPDGSTIALAGRRVPRLPIAAFRAGGLLLEIGSDDLALTLREAQLLLRANGVELNVGELNELVSRCEGWAAGLYLAGLTLGQAADAGERGTRVHAFGGDDRYVTDYVQSEYLAGLGPDAVRFLRRTSVLARMSGPLCDAILEDEGSAKELERIERANLFLVPLDHHRGWFRYHGLFRDLLQRDLAQTEPDLVPILHRRAADWYEANGDPESAFEHAVAGGDMSRAARLLTALALPLYYGGRVATVEAWLTHFVEPGLLDRFPGVALQGAWIHALQGRGSEAERWLDAAENGDFKGALPDGCTSLRPWIAALRAALCRDGVDQMLADAKQALAALPARSLIRPSALIARGAAHMLRGQLDPADEIFADAAEEARRVGANEARVVAISERSLVAFERGDASAAEELASDAQKVVETNDLRGRVRSAIALATSARALLRRGKWAEARAQLEAVDDVAPPAARMTFPWLTVQIRLELARAYLALREGETARQLLGEIEEILQAGPHLGLLADRAASLRREVEALPEEPTTSASGLTGAELRLLPFLATHLSFGEIGTRLYVSRNTVKTQAISIYRRLGVSSRSDAIAEAERLGLIDPAAAASGLLAHNA